MKHKTKGLSRYVVLYFPDEINLKAFALVESLSPAEVNYNDSLLQATLSELQLRKACTIYGAIVKA